VIGWSSIVYGAVLSAVPAGVLVALAARGQRLVVGVGAAIGAAAGPIAWNAILRATHADTFFTDAPIAVMPASWQDTGSGGVPRRRVPVLNSLLGRHTQSVGIRHHAGSRPSSSARRWYS
jgi:hypothetical protein